VAALQQVSKPLQAAIESALKGQMSVTVHTGRLPQAASLMQWLTKHASLLQHLEIQLPAQHFDRAIRARWADTLTAFTTSLRHAAAAGMLRLQSLTLKGFAATPYILRQLPAQHLTQLSAELRFDDSDSLQAVASLTGLRALQLSHPLGILVSPNTAETAELLAPLAAGLQQLTQLHIEPLTPNQLQRLPPKLQQLHVTVDIKHSLQQLTLLARWMQQRGVGIIRTLKLRDTVPFPLNNPDWAPAANALAAAFSSGMLEGAAADAVEAVAAPEAAPAAAAAAASCCQLQSLTVESRSYGFERAEPAWPLLQQLPASSLTHLRLCLDWSSTAQTAALLALTGLRSLDLGAFASMSGGLYSYISRMPMNVLAPLSALQQLTSLKLAVVQRAQLQLLQLPQLQELCTSIDQGGSVGQLLQLGHLTAVQHLTVLDSELPFQAGAVFPPNACSLQCSNAQWDEQTDCAVQPLLALTRLQKLQLKAVASAAAAAELAQLSRLSSLQDIQLTYALHYRLKYSDADIAALPAAWAVLPVKALSYSSSYNRETIPAAIIQQIGALTGLTRLHLNAHWGHVDATPPQLVGMLQQLTALRKLSLQGVRSFAPVVGSTRLTRSAAAALSAAAAGSAGSGATSSSSGSVKVYLDVEVVASLLETVGGMQDLVSGSVNLPVWFTAKEVRQLQDSLQQRLPASLRSGCYYVDSRNVSLTL
jgi:hypothetical protein